MTAVHVKAEKDYVNGMKYKEIAEKHGVSINTVKSWKTRYSWTRDGVHTNEKGVHTKKKDAPIEPIIESDDLNDKQKLFCLYYLKYYNATKAYMKSYGVERNTAESIAYRLMGNDGVKREIERLKQERFKGIFFDAQAVLQKYIDIAFSDITDFVEFGREEVTDDLGNPYEVNRVKFRESAIVDGTLISEIKQGKDGVSVKLADKMKALDFLSKYTDLLNENDRKKLQEEKTKMEIEKTKADIARIKGEEDETEDDGFIDALKTETEEVWKDDDET